MQYAQGRTKDNKAGRAQFIVPLQKKFQARCDVSSYANDYSLTTNLIGKSVNYYNVFKEFVFYEKIFIIFSFSSRKKIIGVVLIY